MQEMVGAQFEDRDHRNKGRIVRVYAVEYGWIWLEVVAHPTLPSYLWRRTRIKLDDLNKRYRRIEN